VLADGIDTVEQSELANPLRTIDDHEARTSLTLAILKSRITLLAIPPATHLFLICVGRV
jgi:hypothetical protein